MTDAVAPIRLPGCRPTPLAHYLKALGVLRLVTEGSDPHAKAYWEQDTFCLATRLAPLGLKRFFLDTYCPTPIVAPWNGGSGFNPKDNQSAIRAIADGKAERFANYRAAIAACQTVRERLGIKEKVATEDKERLVLACRSQLSDDVLRWLDAALVLTAEGPKYPPLLGTGGNDGRLDFSNNFMQRLTDLFDVESGLASPQAESWLDEALYRVIAPGLQTNAIGQFNPGDAGGTNSGAGFGANPLMNPWDFVLMIEGALMFAAAATKRLEQINQGALSFPFSVRQSGVGYGSGAGSDEKDSRAEIWMPLWQRPVPLQELQSVFSEGRAQLGRQPVRTGVDFARAVASLGIDRGIDEFQRYGFQARNGLAYFAVPLGRFRVKSNPRENLLSDIDPWLKDFRKAASRDHAPARATRVLRSLDEAIMELCRRGEPHRLLDVLIAIGEAEETVANSKRWREDAGLRPIPPLPPRWLDELDASPSIAASAEYRLAVGLAGLDEPAFRKHLEPIGNGKNNQSDSIGRDAKWVFSDGQDKCTAVWHSGSLVDNLCAVLLRRILLAGQQSKNGETKEKAEAEFPRASPRSVPLGDIEAFVTSQVDAERLTSLLKGLVLVRQPRRQLLAPPSQECVQDGEDGQDSPFPGTDYALLKLCYHSSAIRGTSVRVEPAIARRAVAGNLFEATRLAIRRLRADGLAPLVSPMRGSPERARRLAAALVFPISDHDGSARRLADAVLDVPHDAKRE
ncbi:MAG: type I-U CRISPR-associated protein Csx17 [Thermoguttaceae bacterium]